MRFFDLHCDMVTKCFDENSSFFSESLEVSLEKAQVFDNWCQLFAIFIDDSDSDIAFEKYQAYAAFFKSQIERYNDKITQCTTADDIGKAMAAKKCAAILTIENAAVLAGNLDHINRLVSDGVKVVTLTWNGENALGFGSAVGGHLKPFGKQAVAEMRRNGILIDVSHLSDEGFDDAMLLCGDHVLATHSNLRSVCGQPRNLTDAQFQALLERGGLIGLNLHRPFLNDSEARTNSIDALFAHVDKMLELGGENNITFGSDFDGAQMPAFCKNISDIPALHEQFATRFGVQIAGKIFFYNAKAYFDRQFTG